MVRAQLSLVAIACAASLLAGCVSAPRQQPSKPSRAAAEPATIAPNATFALPDDSAPSTSTAQRHGGAPPAPLRQMVKPGTTVVLTPRVLTAIGRSIEGTMVARVEEPPGPSRLFIVRVIRFTVPYGLSAREMPALLTLPPGTLVRVTLRDPVTRRDTAVPQGSLRVGHTVSMRVRIGMQPGRAVVRVLAVETEGSGAP